MKNALLVIFLLYALVLLQTSFLVNFNIFGLFPNLTVLSVVLLNFFEPPEKKLGIAAAFCGGIFLDIFSGHFFGYYSAILVVASFFMKYIFKKYVRLWT